jgi:transposase InsO family protein
MPGQSVCSADYRRLLRDHPLLCSMSKKGDDYDNVTMQSWNHSLKVEAIQDERFVTREMAKAQVFEYIEVYYNRRRLHSQLGYHAKWLNRVSVESRQDSVAIPD